MSEKSSQQQQQIDYSNRHPATAHLMEVLRPNPRLDGVAMDISQICWQLAQDAVTILEDGPELTAGLRKLREAKDCLVMQGVLDTRRARLWRLSSCGEHEHGANGYTTIPSCRVRGL